MVLRAKAVMAHLYVQCRMRDSQERNHGKSDASTRQTKLTALQAKLTATLRPFESVGLILTGNNETQPPGRLDQYDETFDIRYVRQVDAHLLCFM